MSKKTNTLLFILGATVFNVLLTFICVMVLFFIFARFIAPYLSEESVAWGLPVCFIGGIVLAFFSYRFMLKQLMKKVDFEKYFDPIFGRKKK